MSDNITLKGGKKMEKIDNYIDPIEDEITVSWFNRLAIANGLPYVFMIQNYFQNDGDDSEASIITRCDYQECFDKVCFSLGIENVYETIMNTTLFNLYSMFCSSSKTAQRIEYSFSNKLKSPLKQYASRDFSELHYCPDCMKEDIKKYGTPILYRSHQVSDVHVCHKHGTQLKIYKGKVDLLNDFEYLESHSSNIPIKASIDTEKQFAIFVHELLKENLSINVEIIRKIIQEKAEYKYGEGKNYKEISKSINQSSISPMFGDIDWQNYFSSTLRSSKSLKKSILLLLSFYFFKTSGNFIKVLKEKETINTDFSPEGIIVLNNYSHGVYKGKCLKCGQEFYSTQYHYMHGFRCKYCDELMPPDVLIERIVQETGNNEYTLENSINSITKSSAKIQLRHTCGTIFTTTLNKFIWQEKKCPCHFRVIKKEILNRFNKTTKGEFELLNMDNSIYNSATIRHKKCGRTYKVNCLSNWLRFPNCPICSPKSYNTKLIENKIKELVGDNYTLIGEYTPHIEGDYSGNMTLRCNNCGREIRYDTVDFFAGARCKCVPRLDTNQFKEFVHIKSYGEYEILDKKCRRDECAIIRNIATGEEKQMERILIRQELTRPTPSSILPLSNGKAPNPVNYQVAREEVYKYIQAHFKKDEIFSMKNDVGEIYVNGQVITERQRASAINVLKTQKKLFLVYNSIYCLDSKTFTVDEILEALYMKRNGKLFGYWSEESYLYQQGVIDKKPDLPIIVTKMVKHNVTRSLRRLPNSNAFLKEPRVNDFSEEDIPYLAFIDLFRYKSKPKYSDTEYSEFIEKLGLDIDKLFEISKKYPGKIQEKFNAHIKKGGLNAK